MTPRASITAKASVQVPIEEVTGVTHVTLLSDCECGCGKSVKPGNRFVHGHNFRGRGHTQTPETRKTISKGMTRWWANLSPEEREAASARLGVKSVKGRRAVGDAQRREWADPEKRAARVAALSAAAKRAHARLKIEREERRRLGPQDAPPETAEQRELALTITGRPQG